MRTNETVQCQTKKLDEALDGRSIDFLKIDVQGAALDVLEFGTKTLETTLMVQCEVEFNQLYLGQPLFAEIDIFMRSQGFMLYRLLPIRLLQIRPVDIAAEQRMSFGQAGWTDAIYIPTHERIDALVNEEIMRLALLVAIRFGYYDLACNLLNRVDRREGKDTMAAFMNEVKTLSSIPFSVGDRRGRFKVR